MIELPDSRDLLFSYAKDLIEFFIFHDIFKASNLIDATRLGYNSWIFRGQSDANWGLKPSAFRNWKALDDFVAQTPEKLDDHDGPYRYLGAHLLAETNALKLFLEAADRAGIHTPLDYSLFEFDEAIKLLNEASNANLDLEFPAKQLQPAFGLAQHYGVPTRLLDWSESPFVACYFAAYEVSSLSLNVKQKEESKEIAIYYIGTNNLPGRGYNFELVQVQRYNNSNLARQHGLFSNSPHANKYLLDKGQWPGLEDYSEIVDRLFRVRLPCSEADELLRILYRLGIDECRLKPNLGTAAQSMSYTRKLFMKDA